jgi:hypothetical protein
VMHLSKSAEKARETPSTLCSQCARLLQTGT